MEKLQIWGGVECTLNRVGDRYIDQCEKSGHYGRLSDIALFQQLGITRLRYPCLWEKTAPRDLDHFDWRFTDERLDEIRRVGLTPIVEFLHHGSGPRYTSLIDIDFPEKFAIYARNFARRYPWAQDYTPINEIVTTARFSCLYGHWYPHLNDDHYFFRAVLLQCKATVLAMRQIRRVNLSARLIQTDDLGRCQSTPELKYQCDYENERRWLGFDLLCGKVDEKHPLYKTMVVAGIKSEEILWFKENACPPDVIGINHYHLSNRFLDHRLELYPEWSHGGNGRDNYADIGAVDCGQCIPPSPESILYEAWERFGIPLAITEVHTKGHRESQLRWLNQIWRAALKVRNEGIKVTAVTVWSLLGSFDWHKLCTKCENFYEPGVFDLRNPARVPAPTALADMLKELTIQGEASAEILLHSGVWETPNRVLWNMKGGEFTSLDFQQKGRPVLITGGTGTLGRSLAMACGARNIPYRLLKRSDLDLADYESVERLLSELRPWAVLNAAGYVKVDEAEKEVETCLRDNFHAATNLAGVCAHLNIALVTYSSDLVFDGKTSGPYIESREVSPLNVYGRSKARAEEEVLKLHTKALIIRTSSFFGPWDQFNFITCTLRSIAKGEAVHVANDIVVSPTYVPDLANESLNLLIDGKFGLYHLVNQGEVTWAELALKTIEIAGDRFKLDSKLIRPKSHRMLGYKAERPLYSALTSERCGIMPPLEHAIKRYVDTFGGPS